MTPAKVFTIACRVLGYGIVAAAIWTGVLTPSPMTWPEAFAIAVVALIVGGLFGLSMLTNAGRVRGLRAQSKAFSSHVKTWPAQGDEQAMCGRVAQQEPHVAKSLKSAALAPDVAQLERESLAVEKRSKNRQAIKCPDDLSQRRPVRLVMCAL
jgi:hypothetical protein